MTLLTLLFSKRDNENSITKGSEPYPETPVNMETFEDQEVKIRYTPWNPFTIDQKIAITPDYVISVMEPSPSILQTYLSNVRSKTGDQGEPPVTPTEVV